jgi:hypothetical protein
MRVKPFETARALTKRAAGVPFEPLIPPGDALWIQAATGTTTATVIEG